jgi:hypothetical protein
MAVDSMVLTYRDYLLIGIIVLSLIAALASVIVLAYKIFKERNLSRQEQASGGRQGTLADGRRMVRQ